MSCQLLSADFVVVRPRILSEKQQAAFATRWVKKSYYNTCTLVYK